MATLIPTLLLFLIIPIKIANIASILITKATVHQSLKNGHVDRVGCGYVQALGFAVLQEPMLNLMT